MFNANFLPHSMPPHILFFFCIQLARFFFFMFPILNFCAFDSFSMLFSLRRIHWVLETQQTCILFAKHCLCSWWFKTITNEMHRARWIFQWKWMHLKKRAKFHWHCVFAPERNEEKDRDRERKQKAIWSGWSNGIRWLFCLWLLCEFNYFKLLETTFIHDSIKCMHLTLSLWLCSVLVLASQSWAAMSSSSPSTAAAYGIK